MPTAYIKKVAKDLKRPVTEIEDYWDKAKKLAEEKFDSKQKQYWAYVMGIFQNMLSLNASDEALCSFVAESARNDRWWEKLPKKQQKAYIKKHPKSKYAKLIGKKQQPEETPKAISEKDQAVAINTVLMAEDKIENEVKDDVGEETLSKGLDTLNELEESVASTEDDDTDLGLEDEDEDEEESTPTENLDPEEKDTSIEDEDKTSEKDLNVEEEEDTDIEEPATTEPTKDLNQEEEEDTEEEDTEEEEEEDTKGKQSAERIPLTVENIKIAKAVIGSIVKGVLGTLAVGLLFTPLLSLVLDLGDMYFKHKYGEQDEYEDGDEEEAPRKKKKVVKQKVAKRRKVTSSSKKDTKFFIHDFTKWLVKQDIKGLVQKTAKKENSD